MRFFLLSVIVLLSGCGVDLPSPSLADAGGMGGGVASTEEALSGTRLKNRYVTGEDGARAPRGFFDTMRNEPCDFAPSEGGDQRCLPLDSVGTIGFLYADASCTERIVIADCTPRYAVEVAPVCPYQIKIYAIETTFAPADYYFGSGGQCSKQNTAQGGQSGKVFAKVGAPIPASSFVLGRYAHD